MLFLSLQNLLNNRPADISPRILGMRLNATLDTTADVKKWLFATDLWTHEVSILLNEISESQIEKSVEDIVMSMEQNGRDIYAILKKKIIFIFF